MSYLHITNGDSAAGLIQQSGIEGRVIPWRDVLHMGPLPAGLDGDAMAEVRAAWLSHVGWADYEATLADMRRRDRDILALDDIDECVLWFEHDLYDQLQLLQILPRLAPLSAENRISLICIDHYDGVEPFHGLGQLNPEQMASLWPQRKIIDASQYACAEHAWQAVCADTPEAVDALSEEECRPLPFLYAALRRHLQELPSTDNGLSRIEQIALEGIAAGHTRPGRLFAEYQAREKAPFLGDWGLWDCLKNLSDTGQPLLLTEQGRPFKGPPHAEMNDNFRQTELRLTDIGQAVLDKRQDAMQLGLAERHWGGVRLKGPGPLWRWDGSTVRYG